MGGALRQDVRLQPEKAKALLKEAGYGPGQLKFKILAFTEPGESEGPQVAEALGIYYKEIGVETEIEVLDWAKVREMFRKKTIQCCIWPNIISWRPAEEWIRISNYSKGPNHHFEDEFIEKTYAAWSKAVKPDERQRLARAIADHLFDEFADILLYWFANEVVANPKFVSEWVYPAWPPGDRLISIASRLASRTPTEAGGIGRATSLMPAT